VSLKAACNGCNCATTLAQLHSVVTTADTDALINAAVMQYRHSVINVQQDDSAAQTVVPCMHASDSNNTTGVMHVYDARSQAL
jgi:hypothetical protein